MRTPWLVWVVATSCYFVTFVGAEAQQQNNNKNAPPPRAVVRPQQVPRQMPMMPGQVGVHPGQVGQFHGPGVALARPGVVRGPAGSLQRSKPANVAFDPRHKVGSAGTRYNKQAFAFRRGGHFYRRHYYIGPDGGVYFYDEGMSADDPMLAGADAVAGMPVCPADADDCQGFNDPQGAQDNGYAQALQFLMSSRPNVIWADGGLNITTNDDTGEAVFIPYANWRIRFHRAKVFGLDMGKEAITIVSPTNGEIDVLVDSYAQYKDLFDQVLKSLVTVGMHPMPLGADDMDFTAVVSSR